MPKVVITYICIVLGAFLQGLGMSLFLFPHNIPSGGAAGLAILMNHWVQLPLGLSLWIVNFSFLILALKYFGFSWTVKTMVAVTITSVTVSYVSTLGSFLTPFFWLDLLCGAVTFGVGVGLLIRSGSSSGGMVIPTLMIAKYNDWSPGKVMLWMNFFIFLLTASVIDIRIVFYAILCQTVSTNIIDFIYHLRAPTFITTNQLGWRKK
ncbi:YitT family protein [Fredinandcohnia sp. QZ13]|uniref:YitT family protein n=1 Tax=Fredinandcohnia sp. QZ13 TaxID=3073144 RepID=UPI0028532EFF|nr:YitT family protein [Fredinandcohnia sp. QZ13]MDR4888595.1 YitT family protein [Fredinandcohnia sp. QZ13]